MKFNLSQIPEEVVKCLKALESADFEANLVGGCVRDLVLSEVEGLGREPKDWDIMTNATPEQIQKIFPDSAYENAFGTVAVKTRSKNQKLKIIEITTYRVEGKYTDKRHPDEVKFAKTVEEDLSRRDFTINAMALKIKGEKFELADPYGGREDLKNKIIRTVGEASQRFNEDALRLMRAVRFSAELGLSSGWRIENETEAAIKKQAGLLEMIAKERIRDEFVKLIMADDAMKGIEKLEELGILKFIMPELREGIGITQDRHHIYAVWEHNLRSLDYTVKKKYSLEVRLAALLHDLGKPKTKAGKTPNSTFYNHEMVGAKMAAKALDRLCFSKAISEKTIHLVRYHMFYYNVGEVTEAGVRRFLVRVGPENIDDFIKVREADRIGSGVPKAVPYKIRHLLFMIDKVKRDPISPKMLKLNGSELMEFLKITPSPRVGWILGALLEEVIEDPKRNEKEYLENKAKELNDFSDIKLKKLFEKAREVKDEFETEAEEKIKKKHYVK